MDSYQQLINKLNQANKTNSKVVINNNYYCNIRKPQYQIGNILIRANEPWLEELLDNYSQVVVDNRTRIYKE